jgi:hypothetical protein
VNKDLLAVVVHVRGDLPEIPGGGTVVLELPDGETVVLERRVRIADGGAAGQMRHRQQQPEALGLLQGAQGKSGLEPVVRPPLGRGEGLRRACDVVGRRHQLGLQPVDGLVQLHVRRPLSRGRHMEELALIRQVPRSS